MMKKNGFTLAEVLITLAIIGVVATMTLPALMTNTQEQQAKTGLKKAINTLTEAAQMHLASDNYDYSNLAGGYGNIALTTTNDDGEEVAVDNANTLISILDARTALDYNKTRTAVTGEDGTITYSNAITTAAANFGGANGQTLYLKDGSAILLPAEGTLPSGYDTLKSDGAVNGFVIIYDTNGSKAPNALSNCSGAVNGAADADISDATDATATNADLAAACLDKSKRVIKDQFAIRLRGNTAVPAGAAATWAYNN